MFSVVLMALPSLLHSMIHTFQTVNIVSTIPLDITPGPPIPPPRVLHRDSAVQEMTVPWCASFPFFIVGRKLAGKLHHLQCKENPAPCASVCVRLVPYFPPNHLAKVTTNRRYACLDLGYEYAEGTWIVDTLSPDHVWYNQWQIMLGSSAYFLCVMFESEMETVVRETKETK